MAAPETSPNTPAVGLLFDINPADPLVISALVGVACVLVVAALCLRNGKGQRSGVGVGQEEEEQQQQHEGQTVGSRPRYNTRGHRVASPPGSGESSAGRAVTVTPQQAALCEVLYDVYAGVVPARGIESKTVRQCNLSTAEIRRQFKNIKQAREAASARPATRRAAPVKPTSRGGSASAAASPSPKKKPPVPVSPRRTPVKRGVASRPAPPSTSSPPRSRAKASVLPSPSPSRLRTKQPSPASPGPTRGKGSSRAASSAAAARVGSPKSTPTKRAAAAGASSLSSPRSGASGTPSKRGKPSVLETARREAQQQAADVASTRASNLRAQAGSAGKRRAKP